MTPFRCPFDAMFGLKALLGGEDSCSRRSSCRGMRSCLPFYLIFGCGLQMVSAGSNLPLLSGTLRTFQVHACDGNELKIECWPNTVINIYLAQYGRQVPSHQLCPPDGTTESTLAMLNDTTNCLSTHALRTVEESCREKRICKVRTSPQTFGGTDPCPGVRKYAEVAFKCRPNVFSNKVVCEGDRLRLRCQKNLRIVIYSATFGATHYGVPECPQPGGEGHIEDCQVSYATETVMSSCHGQRKCSIGADVGTFGKPGCPLSIRLFLKVVHTCVPKEILKDLDLGGAEDKDQDDSDYTGFVEEPRYIPPPTVHEPGQPPTLGKLPSTLKPRSDEEVTKSEVQQTTVKTDMQSDENSGEEGEDVGDPGGRRQGVGFLTEWVSAYNFIKENKEKFILYLTLSLSVALVAILAILTTRFYVRRSRRRREERTNSPKPPLPDTPPSGGGISPFGEDCTDLDHFNNPSRDSGVEVVRFATRSSLRRAQPIEDDDCSFPRAPVRAQNNYYYS